MVSLKLKDEYKPTLYYGKYKFKAKFKLAGVGRTRYAANFLEYKSRLEAARDGYPNSRLFKVDYDKIEKFINWKKQFKNTKNILLIRVEYDTGIVYTNDLNHLSGIDAFGEKIEYTQVNDDIPTGVKYFGREPKYKYRVYFKSKRVSKEIKETIKELEERYAGTSNSLYYSKGLKRWINSNWATYIQNNFYIDYDDASTYTLLSLMIGDLFSINYNCVKKPKS